MSPMAFVHVCTSISNPSASATRDRIADVTSDGLLRPEPDESADPKTRLMTDWTKVDESVAFLSPISFQGLAHHCYSINTVYRERPSKRFECFTRPRLAKFTNLLSPLHELQVVRHLRLHHFKTFDLRLKRFNLCSQSGSQVHSVRTLHKDEPDQ